MERTLTTRARELSTGGIKSLLEVRHFFWTISLCLPHREHNVLGWFNPLHFIPLRMKRDYAFYIMEGPCRKVLHGGYRMLLCGSPSLWRLW